jgi:ABC-type transport system substrate-binding protein
MELNQKDWIYKTNLDEAKGALFDSGYKIGKDPAVPYRVDSKGKVLEMVLLARQYTEGTSQATETAAITGYFTKALADAGVKLDVRYEEAAAFSERLRARDYDMVLTGQSLGYNLDTYSFWHSSQGGAVGLNLSNYRSFAADALIEKIRDTFDNDVKSTLLKDLAGEISADIPAIFLFKPGYIFATDGKVKGMKLDNLSFISDRFAHVEQWCINCG